MDTNSLIIFIVVGALAGWLAGNITKGKGFGLIGNIVIGVIGAFLGVWLLGVLGIATNGIIGLIVAAIIGAIVLIYVIKLVKK